MKQWKVVYEREGNVLMSKIFEASSAAEAESKALWFFRGNDTFRGIVSVEQV